MLTSLKIHNLFLFESLVAHFDCGFTILTGESGAGKSALIRSISLLMGEKIDKSIITNEKDKGFIEAEFRLSKNDSIQQLLESYDIEWDSTEPLIIRKELSQKGRARQFINDQIIPIDCLKNIAEKLFHVVSQHSSTFLLNSSTQRTIFDTYIGTEPLVEKHKSLFKQFNFLSKKADEQKNSLDQKEKELHAIKEKLEEIEKVNLKPDEEETLLKELTKNEHAQNIKETLFELERLIHEQEPSLFSYLYTASMQASKIAKKDTDLSPIHNHIQSAKLELQEALFSIQSFQSHYENNPERIIEITERLNEINQLMKKFGNTYEEVMLEKNKLEAILEQSSLDKRDYIQTLEKLSQTKGSLNHLTNSLSEKRHKEKKEFIEAVQKELPSLNMDQGIFDIQLTPCDLNSYGKDDITFFFSANKGSAPISLHKAASGGELSRLLLILQTSFENNLPQTIIFDEIDANVGGQSAAKIGLKLSKLGSKNQVICISHFKQTAQHADHHFKIFKKVKDNQTYSLMEKLCKKGRIEEFSRMTGD